MEILYHALPSAHLTDFTGFASCGASCLSWCNGGVGVVRTPPSSSLPSSSSSPTPNSSSRSSQTSASAKLPERARPLPFLVLFCGNSAEGGVSGLLCSGRSCVPDSSSSSEGRLSDELDAERGRYSLQICRDASQWCHLLLYPKGERADVPPAFGDSISRGDMRRITQFQTRGDLPSQKAFSNAEGSAM